MIFDDAPENCSIAVQNEYDLLRLAQRMRDEHRYSDARTVLASILRMPEIDFVEREIASNLMQRCLVEELSPRLGTRHEPGSRNEMRLSATLLSWLETQGLGELCHIDDEAMEGFARFDLTIPGVNCEWHISEAPALTRLKLSNPELIVPASLRAGVLAWLNLANLNLPFGCLVLAPETHSINLLARHSFWLADCLPEHLDGIFQTSLSVMSQLQPALLSLCKQNAESVEIPAIRFDRQRPALPQPTQVVDYAQRSLYLFDDLQTNPATCYSHATLHRKVRSRFEEPEQIWQWDGDLHAYNAQSHFVVELRLRDFDVPLSRLDAVLAWINACNHIGTFGGICLDNHTLIARQTWGVAGCTLLSQHINALAGELDALGLLLPDARQMEALMVCIGS